MIKTLIYNFKIAAEAIVQNKLRAVLTSLGIICGVGSVIAMLSIGKGAEQEILEKMKILGANNIIIKTKDLKIDPNAVESDDEESSQSDDQKINKKRFSPGMTLKDAEGLAEVLPDVDCVSPEIVLETTSYHNSFKKTAQLVGISDAFFKVNQYSLFSGRIFSALHYNTSESVCIIGWGVKTKLFPAENPIGKLIKCSGSWLRVIGVLGEKSLSEDNIQALGIRDYNLDVYVPIKSMLLRFANRSLITKKDLGNSRRRGAVEEIASNINQIDRIVIKFKSNKMLNESASVIEKMLTRRHNQVKDFEIVVPEQLLEQEQNTKRIFNIVLGAIASISLIVGGIGIMNIMLASVLERTKEIGIRRAVGAQRSDILIQFLSEAVAISLSGGIIGIISGYAAGLIIESATSIHTIVSFESVVLSFFVSITVGLVFGIAPAKKAAKQDVIDLLRYE